MGLDDDCEELAVLRRFRDEYLMQLGNGPELVRIYYEHSPGIVSAIRRRDEEDEIYERLYRIITGCVDRIKKGDNLYAYNTYRQMVVDLAREFTPQIPLPIELG